MAFVFLFCLSLVSCIQFTDFKDRHHILAQPVDVKQILLENKEFDQRVFNKLLTRMDSDHIFLTDA